MVKLISKETMREAAIQRRLKMAENSNHPRKSDILSELHYGNIPQIRFPDGFDIRQHVQEAGSHDRQRGILGEFVGTGNFNTEWFERQRYEVYAGRDEEAELWRAVYVETADSNLPRTIDVNRIGPGGVVFEEVHEGGEVKFVNVESSNFTVRLVDYAIGLEYSKELVKYNELWDVSIVERQAGIAHNALQNHIHFTPILNGTYSTGADTETAASAIGSNLLEKYQSTFEDAVQDAKSRDIRGPFVLLCGSLNYIKAAKALEITIQDGNPARSPVVNMISSIIEYDGWSGTRNGKDTAYAGVADNVGYLIGLSDRANDFRSYQKQGLQQMMGNPDVSRRIMAQTIWDLDRGVYCDTTAVQKINFPTS